MTSLGAGLVGVCSPAVVAPSGRRFTHFRAAPEKSGAVFLFKDHDGIGLMAVPNISIATPRVTFRRSFRNHCNAQVQPLDCVDIRDFGSA